jgi:hypothetical protein
MLEDASMPHQLSMLDRKSTFSSFRSAPFACRGIVSLPSSLEM